MRGLFHLLCLVLLLSGTPTMAQPSEEAVKAAFLPRFARYVTWPPAARPQGRAPFLLCVIGVDPFGRTLDQAVAKQTVEGRSISVRRLASSANAEGCHIAFVQPARGQDAGRLLAALANRPVLTVTDARNGNRRGIIHFSVVDGRVRFLIDEAAASRRELSISSRLLALAIGVTERAR